MSQINQRPSWRDNPPPLIPVYFIDIIHLREVIENGGISDFALDLLLGYYEEFEMYEKAAVIQEYLEGDDLEVDPSVLHDILENPMVSRKNKKEEENFNHKPKDKDSDFDPFGVKNPFS